MRNIVKFVFIFFFGIGVAVVVDAAFPDPVVADRCVSLAVFLRPTTVESSTGETAFRIGEMVIVKTRDIQSYMTEVEIAWSDGENQVSVGYVDPQRIHLIMSCSVAIAVPTSTIAPTFEPTLEPEPKLLETPAINFRDWIRPGLQSLTDRGQIPGFCWGQPLLNTVRVFDYNGETLEQAHGELAIVGTALSSEGKNMFYQVYTSQNSGFVFKYAIKADCALEVESYFVSINYAPKNSN